MELNTITRTVNYYSMNLIRPEMVEAMIYPIQFEFLTSGYYKHNFMLYNYKKEGCYLTYYQGIDGDDKNQIALNCKSKFVTLTYPTSDKKDFLYQIEVLNLLSQKFNGHIFDPKTKKVITAGEVKFLIK